MKLLTSPHPHFPLIFAGVTDCNNYPDNTVEFTGLTLVSGGAKVRGQWRGERGCFPILLFQFPNPICSPHHSSSRLLPCPRQLNDVAWRVNPKPDPKHFCGETITVEDPAHMSVKFK